MAISRQELERIAKLARIGLTEEEKRKFVGELSAVIDYFEKLKEVDTSSVDLNLSEVENLNVTREDKSVDTEIQEAILKNAPLREERYFKVKSVL